MGNQTTTGPRIRALRAACDVAFRHWAWRVEVWQALGSTTNAGAEEVEEARRHVAQAATAYRAQRNLLAEFLLDLEMQKNIQARPELEEVSTCMCAGTASW